mmetsp:Transcript_85256/g.239794  ORF Transcript_85256/g.239794 Transcript_85256/m.239794 type:complete len:419 (+) Transcript_85256:55-1311(+)
MADGKLSTVLSRYGIQPRYHKVIEDLCGGQADFLSDILPSDLDGRIDDEGSTITGPVARGLIRKLQEGGGVAAEASVPPPAASVAAEEAEVEVVELPEDPSDLRAVRRAVAAQGRLDEGMRGTPADVLKLRAAADPAIVSAIAAGLRGRLKDATHAAAALRSIAITPAAALQACEAGVPAALAEALQRPAVTAGPVLTWALPAVARLAQHRETHGRLMAANFARLLEAHAHGRVKASSASAWKQGKEDEPVRRLDLVAAIALAFLSESGGVDLASRVPLRAVPDFVDMLQKRLFVFNADEVVSSRSFCGLPLYWRPRFMLQAVARLVEHSGAHCATAWRTSLPELLVALLEGDLPGDAAENKPYGSPDVLDMAKACGQSMLAAHAGLPEARDSLQRALQVADVGKSVAKSKAKVVSKL